MAKTFSPINILIKGSSASIQQALALPGLPEYECRYLSYDPNCVDSSDTQMKEVGLIFELFTDKYMAANDIPFAKMPDVKFVVLGDGGDDFRSDGSYAAYKDFGETSVKVCYRFSNANPHMEEFESQYEVLERVQESFLDHIWEFTYDDYSCGAYLRYAFNKKKDKELVEKWKDDRDYKPDGKY